MENLNLGVGFPRALHVIVISDPSVTVSSGASVVMFVSLGASVNMCDIYDKLLKY